MTETYNGLVWEIDDFPVGSSTPDEFYELDFRAKANCPECGSTIDGTAHYLSRSDDYSNSWLDRIDYNPCEQCEDSDEEEDWYIDEDF